MQPSRTLINSTNVRNKPSLPPEDTPRTLFLALGIWAVATVLAAMQGVFAKLSMGELGALSLFASGFALASTYLDRSLRDYLATRSTRSYLTFAIEIDLGVAIGTMIALGLAQGRIEAALTSFPLAVVIVFALPVAAVAHVLLAQRLLRRDPVHGRRPGAEASQVVLP